MSTDAQPRPIDFHCHLDLYPDHAAAVAQREREGIFTLAVTTTPKAWYQNYELASATRHVRAALGLHPQLVADRSHELPLWKELLSRTRYVGEVGLDAGPRFYKSFELQKSVFGEILSECADRRGKILSVHSVRSSKIVLDLIETHLPPTHGRVVLHWFTGSPAEARRAVDMGCFFSVNKAMLDTDKRRKLVRSIPLERLLTETDGPFIETSQSPQGPSGVTKAIKGLADLFALDIAHMERLIDANFRRLLADGE